MGRRALRLPGPPPARHDTAGDPLNAGRPTPRRDHEALLDRIAETAIDDDYVHRSHQRPPGPVRKVAFGLVLAAIGALGSTAVVGLRSEGRDAELERQALIADVIESRTEQERSAAIAAQLRRDVATLRRERGVDLPETGDLGVVTGVQSATGPGVIIRVDNGPGAAGLVSDTDLQLLVNGLWHAGAEAVSVDDERIGSLTSIRSAGDAITVNFRSIRAPYVVVALGDPDALLTRFRQSPTGHFWEERRHDAGVRFDMKASSDNVVPAVPERRVEIAHATVLAGEGGRS